MGFGIPCGVNGQMESIGMRGMELVFKVFTYNNGLVGAKFFSLVKFFFNNIGYGNRAVRPPVLPPEASADRLVPHPL